MATFKRNPHIQELDHRILTGLLTYCVEHGYDVALYDAEGDDYIAGPTAFMQKIMDNLVSMDEERLRIFDGEKRVGSVLLVHGNEDGVIISDYSCHTNYPQFENFMEALADIE